MLRPDEKAALALSLTAARYLDPECDNEPDGPPPGFRVSRGKLLSAAIAAPDVVKSFEDLVEYLGAQAAEIKPYAVAGSPAIRSAQQCLQRLADGALPDNGDGSACSGHALAPHCACGVLEMAGRIEQRIRALLERDAGVPAGSEPVINYVTRLEPELSISWPSRVSGGADIQRSPRQVALVLICDGFDARDLLLLAYVLHHELVCHAFQAAHRHEPPNAYQSCHWSEGWMDTLAFDLVSAWATDPSSESWLPLRGPDAAGALSGFHEARYNSPPLPDKGDRKRRKNARRAYRGLADALWEFRIAESKDEAQSFARCFALTANSHENSDCKRLKALASILSAALLSRARRKDAATAAQACLKFVGDRDLDELERTLGELHRQWLAGTNLTL